jgi:uncharacterized RDD family membrane protein YckC
MEFESKEMAEAGKLVVHTPEGIFFSIELAGPATRCAALMVDLAVVYTILLVTRKAVDFLGIFNIDIATAVSFVLYFTVTVGYQIVLEWYWRGQTVGKRLLRIRVTDVSGLRLRFGQIAVRNLLRAVDVLPAFYMLGGLSCAVNKKSQRLGDIAANTVVSKVTGVFAPDMEKLFPDKYNSFRHWPHLAARLRQRVSPNEAAIALKAILRRDLLGPESRLVLFKQIAEHLRAKVRFPQEAIEGISDEKYVGNAVEILYRDGKS